MPNWENAQQKLNSSSNYHATARKVHCVGFFQAVSKWTRISVAHFCQRIWVFQEAGRAGGVWRLPRSCTSFVHSHHHWRSLLTAVEPSMRWFASLTFPAGWGKPRHSCSAPRPAWCQISSRFTPQGSHLGSRHHTVATGLIDDNIVGYFTHSVYLALRGRRAQ